MVPSADRSHGNSDCDMGRPSGWGTVDRAGSSEFSRHAPRRAISERQADEAKGSNLVSTWTPEEDQRLLEMKAAGALVALIAKALNRTESSTTSRLTVLRRKASRIDTSDPPQGLYGRAGRDRLEG
jgi:hypothetical protein